MKKTAILFILLCGSLYSSLAAGIKVIPLYIGQEKFMIEIADTTEKQLTGLMFREFIPDDFGMLFIYRTEYPRSFWMKNCQASLDIIFLDKNKQVINIHFNVPPCEDDPCKTYESERPAQYVLELRGNRAKELNLKPGDTIFFSLDR